MTLSACRPLVSSLRAALLGSFALSLAACSGSFDRFSDYPNVNTSSLPDNAEASDEVRSRPIDRATLEPNRPAWQNSRARNQMPGQGGMIVVEPGQTLYSIARTYNMSPAELAEMNDLAPPYALSVGMRIRVPGQGDDAMPAQANRHQRMQLVSKEPPREVTLHHVKTGETLFSIGRTYHVSPYMIAEFNRLPKPYALRTGQALRIPSAAGSQMTLKAPPTVSEQKVQPAEQTPPKQATAEQQVPAEEPSEQVAEQAPALEQGAQEPPAAETTFRWPVKGRIISAFGQKPNGMRNEGINIAVPEGTSIRAAESGVVAYSGNELKGYGNLVLIRHENGWVTAYAHNKELFVKRGDTVKRGDVIAKAGQTGSVTSPQLHFELRKGATAVDPMRHLGADQAMN
jgi:murein DD-endopeptidase MepM/ murein hydrolase activator NlpD